MSDRIAPSQNGIVGVWDLSVLSPRFGGAITFVYELELLRMRDALERVYLCFLGAAQQCDQYFNLRPVESGVSDLSESCRNDPGFLGAMFNLAPLSGILFAETREALEILCRPDTLNARIWPEASLPPRLSYDSPLLLKNILPDGSPLPRLTMKEPVTLQARTLLASLATPDTIWVSVNLKNSASDPQSNADTIEWSRFFNERLSDSAVKFILVGSDPVAHELRGHKNVFSSRDFSGSSALDLALIAESSFFMGMANGPSQMAVLAHMPYAIFKHPDHHVLEMNNEIGCGEHFWFASNNQRLIRTRENVTQLSAAFQGLLEQVLSTNLPASS